MASGSQLESEWTSNLPFVLYMFFWHTRAMDDDLRPVPRREFLFDVEQALRTAAKLWPRRRVHGDYNPLRPMANTVVKHLELCGIRCFRKNPPIGHSMPAVPLHEGEDETPPKG